MIGNRIEKRLLAKEMAGMISGSRHPSVGRAVAIKSVRPAGAVAGLLSGLLANQQLFGKQSAEKSAWLPNLLFRLANSGLGRSLAKYLPAVGRAGAQRAGQVATAETAAGGLGAHLGRTGLSPATVQAQQEAMRRQIAALPTSRFAPDQASNLVDSQLQDLRAAGLHSNPVQALNQVSQLRTPPPGLFDGKIAPAMNTATAALMVPALGKELLTSRPPEEGPGLATGPVGMLDDVAHNFSQPGAFKFSSDRQAAPGPKSGPSRGSYPDAGERPGSAPGLPGNFAAKQALMGCLASPPAAAPKPPAAAAPVKPPASPGPIGAPKPLNQPMIAPGAVKPKTAAAADDKKAPVKTPELPDPFEGAPVKDVGRMASDQAAAVKKMADPPPAVETERSLRTPQASRTAAPAPAAAGPQPRSWPSPRPRSTSSCRRSRPSTPAPRPRPPAAAGRPGERARPPAGRGRGGRRDHVPPRARRAGDADARARRARGLHPAAGHRPALITKEDVTNPVVRAALESPAGSVKPPAVSTAEGTFRPGTPQYDAVMKGGPSPTGGMKPPAVSTAEGTFHPGTPSTTRS
jgi:hypothetical protein